MNTKEKEKLIKEALIKQTAGTYPSREALEKVLKSGKKLIIYWGIDPTAPDIHLGHSTNLFVLKRFQKLGHRVIILIGDYTAQIGDPTGRDKKRMALNEGQVKRNLKTYKKQVLKILDPLKTIFKFNSQWWDKMSAKKLLELDGLFTHQQVIERDMFQRRLKDNNPISIKEFQYPLLQGYDSVVLRADIELGATDQLFNMLVGRHLARVYLGKEKFIITTPLLVNPKTGQKLMSKSKGNYISLNDSSKQMYGKIMALPDEVMLDCFQLCTDFDEKEVAQIKEILKAGDNPRDIKIRLAHEVVRIYHGAKAAEDAAYEFHKVFIDKEPPKNIPSLVLKWGDYNIVELLVKSGLVSSKSEARRLVTQGGVKIGDETIGDVKIDIKLKTGLVLKIGKRKFIRLVVK